MVPAQPGWCQRVSASSGHQYGQCAGGLGSGHPWRVWCSHIPRCTPGILCRRPRPLKQHQRGEKAQPAQDIPEPVLVHTRGSTCLTQSQRKTTKHPFGSTATQTRVLFKDKKAGKSGFVSVLFSLIRDLLLRQDRCNYRAPIGESGQLRASSVTALCVAWRR